VAGGRRPVVGGPLIAGRRRIELRPGGPADSSRQCSAAELPVGSPTDGKPRRGVGTRGPTRVRTRVRRAPTPLPRSDAPAGAIGRVGVDTGSSASLPSNSQVDGGLDHRKRGSDTQAPEGAGKGGRMAAETRPEGRAYRRCAAGPAEAGRTRLTRMSVLTDALRSGVASRIARPWRPEDAPLPATVRRPLRA